MMVDALLPHEPRVADERQATLTERFLLPALVPLTALFAHLREHIDPVLAARMPVKLGKPYPQGQSLEIALAMQDALRQLDPATLPAAAGAGFAALVPFLTQGGDARVVWGAQHGAHFHNALLFGTLYIDVAHDADAPGAAKVVLRPFRQAGLLPLRDHHHFALLAGRTWQARVYPNHLVPTLAPYAPLIVLAPGGSPRIESNSSYMFGLAAAGGFASSAAVLRMDHMPADLFQLAATVLTNAGIAVAADPAAGRAQGLARCAYYRDQRRRPGDAYERPALDQLGRVNAQLQALQVSAAS